MKKCKICDAEFQPKGRQLCCCEEHRREYNRLYYAQWRNTHRKEYNAYMRQYMHTGKVHGGDYEKQE